MKYLKIIENSEEMLKYNRFNFVLNKIVFQRFFIIAIVFVAISILCGYNGIGKTEVIYISITKFVFILLIGIMEGNLEWNFYSLINSNKSTRLSGIRNRFVLNIGIMSWGLPMAIGNFRYPIESIEMFIVDIFIWLIVGFIFGIIMWSSKTNKYMKHIRFKIKPQDNV